MKFGLRELLLLLILIAVPIASWWMVFRPQNREIQLAKQEIQHKRAMLEKLREETSRNSDLERANTEMKESIELIEARLPNNKEIDSVVRQVSNIAVESGLGSPALKSEKPLSAALYMEQPLQIKMTGEFKGFYDFLLSLEQLPRITRIPDLKLVRSDKKDGYLVSEFTLAIYFQDEGKARMATGQ